MLGLQELKEEIGAYIHGKSPVPYIRHNESGSWRNSLPKKEIQLTGDREETSGCTVWAGLNTVEILIKFLYGYEVNYSERFTYILAKVVPGKGRDPQYVFESIRNDGVVDERYLPMTDTLDEFMDPSSITGSLLARAQFWKKQNVFKHDWLWELGKRPANYKDILRDALKTSPLAITVYAWEEENGVYVSYGDENTHICVLIEIDEQDRPVVFDSYNQSIKTLSADHNIRRAKRIWINTNRIPELSIYKRLLQVILNKLMGTKTILEIANKYISSRIDPTPNDEYPDEISCAWTLSKLEQEADPTFPRIAGTWTLWNHYRTSDKFEETTTPTPGTRVICATAPGHPFPGHCGIFMEDMTIASNDSPTGLFIKNYDRDSWNKRWVTRGGYKVYYYNKIK